MDSFTKVSIVPGDNPLLAAQVLDGGRLATDASGSELSAGPLASEMEPTKGDVGVTDMLIADANPNRSQIMIQNLHDTNSIHLGFDDAAALNDFRIPPGGTFSFPYGVVFKGEIRGISDDVDTGYVCLEFSYTPPEEA